MKINVNVKHRFKINGKEYGSLEDMPADIRMAFEKAMTAGPADGTKIVTTKTRIVFNGREYEGVDAMSPDDRRLYEQAMKAAEGGEAGIDIAEIGKTLRSEVKMGDPMTAQRRRTPETTESSFSPRALIVSIALVAVIILVFMLLHGR